MPSLLIRRIDKRMPTVAEWRKQMNEYTIPKAQELAAAYPDAAEAIACVKKVEDYQAAVATLAQVGTAKEPTVEEQTKAAISVSAWTAKPVTQSEFDRAKHLHKPTTYEGAIIEPRKFEPGEYVGPSIVERHKYYKHQVEVEALKADEDKAAELAEKDQRGCSKRGDIIGVWPTGHKWGDQEGPPQYLNITVEGAERDDLIYLIEPERDDSDPDRPQIIRKHRYSVDISHLEQDQTIKLDEFLALVTDKAKK